MGVLCLQCGFFEVLVERGFMAYLLVVKDIELIFFHYKEVKNNYI